MKRFGLVTVVAGVFLALAPVAASADTISDLQTQRELNIQNDIARCQLAAMGVFVPGNVTPSQPESVRGCAGGFAPMSAGTPSVGCPAAGRALTTFEKNAINQFEIDLLKAMNNRTTLPTPSADVQALLTC